MGSAWSAFTGFLPCSALRSGTQGFVVWAPSLAAEVPEVLVTLSFPPRQRSDRGGAGSLLRAQEGEGGDQTDQS